MPRRVGARLGGDGRRREARATIVAEPRAGGVLVSARWAAHGVLMTSPRILPGNAASWLCYGSGRMITGPIIAEIAALVGDPTRATMVSALLDGRALTASELAWAARITPQTASTHLAKLTQAGLLAMVRNGRHRYFRLASPIVVDMIDGIVAVALEKRPRYPPLSGHARALSAARICYDHLAGRLSVDLTDAFIARNTSCPTTTRPRRSQTAGIRVFTEFGIELPTLRSAAATWADSASIGPSDARTSRVR